MPRTVPFLIAFKQDLEAFFMFCMIALSQCVKKISLFQVGFRDDKTPFRLPAEHRSEAVNR